MAERIPGGATTGIGSLPHHNIDSALEFAFQFDIPFLPQIPMRNPWEFAVAQGLDGLPGVRLEGEEALATVDLSVWAGRAQGLNLSLEHAFENSQDPLAFEAFEPSAATSSSWQPFFWELAERKCRLAKIQTIGPLTAQWTLRVTDGPIKEVRSELGQQIFRLVLARCLAMCRKLRSLGVQPLLFLDEPALFVFSKTDPRHLVALEELKVLVGALRKEGVQVAIHCCSNTDWKSVLGVGLDWLSFDTRLSMDSLLESAAALREFLFKGGRLCLGVVPTTRSSDFEGLDAQSLVQGVESALKGALGNLGESAFRNALWTPACGLALHTPDGAQTVLSQLKRLNLPRG